MDAAVGTAEKVGCWTPVGIVPCDDMVREGTTFRCVCCARKEGMNESRRTQGGMLYIERYTFVKPSWC